MPYSLPAPTHIASLEEVAASFAMFDEHTREAAIDYHSSAAIRERRIDDMVFWQRVRFRARLLCAVAQRKAIDPPPVGRIG